MSQSIKDYYLRLHSTRSLITELTAYYKGMKSSNDDIFSSMIASSDDAAGLRRKLIGMKQALLDTTTGGYFLKDIASAAAFNEGLPPEAESFFSVLFTDDDENRQKFMIRRSADPSAYASMAMLVGNASDPMSTRDVISPVLASWNQEQSIDAAKTRELANNDNPSDDKTVLKVDKDKNPIYGLTAVSTHILQRPTINQSPHSPPDRFSNPTLGAIVFKRLVQSKGKSTGFSIANRNSDLINLFFNAIPPIEMSRCTPYINMHIITPKNATMDEFNNVAFMRFIQDKDDQQRFILDDNIGVGSSIPVGLDSFDARVIVDKKITGMDIFLSPQMMSNADIRKTSIDAGSNSISGNKILEPISPFLTLESVSTDISSAGQALLQSKTATFKLTLHDRSRLKDIAPLISPEQFGMTKIFMEYGWSHPDGDITSNNDFGRLLNSLRDVGIYTVQSSNFSFSDGNTVGIDVTLACMGGTNETKNISAAAGIATPLNVFRPALEKVAEALIKEKSGNNIEHQEVRKVIKVNKRSLNGTNSLVYHSKFLELAREAGFAGNTKADDAKLIQLFSGYLNPSMTKAEKLKIAGYKSDGTQVFADAEIDNSTLSKESIVSLLYGKAYGFTETSGFQEDSSIAGSSGTLHKTPDPFINSSFEQMTSDSSYDPEFLKLEYVEYVSLGKVLLSFIGHSMATSGRCDEVQMLFYPLNNQAAGARTMTTASFPISKWNLIEMLKKQTRDKRKTNITVKTFFNLIEKTFIADSKNSAYGLSDAYNDIEEANKQLKKEAEAAAKLITDEKKKASFVKLSSEAKDKKIKQLRASYDLLAKTTKEQNSQLLEKRLASLYDADGLDSGVENKFVKPNLSMLIETVPALGPTQGINFNKAVDIAESDMFDYMKDAQGSKQITRIHIYDERAAANSDAQFYQQLIDNMGVISMAGGTISENDEVNILGKIKSIFTKSEETVQDEGENEEEVEVKLVKVNPDISTSALKDMIKDYFPNVTLGTNNSTVKSISVSSSTSGDVNNVLLLNSLGNKKLSTPGGSDIIDQEELRVIPSTIQLVCLGLPVIQRGNQLYIDMGTGTTLDNIYTVTSVKHNIKAGGFDTTLTLTCTNQGDTDSLKSKINTAVKLK
jgi:hypothetical protein